MSGGRIDGDPPLADSETAARVADPGDAVLVSGFGGVGYPKAVPEALADRDDAADLDLTVVSGGGVGEEIDAALVESGAMARRYPFQTQPTAREAINEGRIAFHDAHISRVADAVLYGGWIDDGVAVVEAVSVGEGWLVPSTSIGNTRAFVEAADRLIVEVNRAQPLALRRVHDVYDPGPPPERDPIPLSDPLERIGGPRIEFDPGTLECVVETDRPDDPYEFRDPTAVDRAIADELRAFLEGEIASNPALDDRLHIQFGVGSMGNALTGAIADADLGDREVLYFGEVVQDGLLDLLDRGSIAGASATSLALSTEGQRRFFERIDRYAEDVVLRPADVSNAAGPIERFGVVGINSAVEVDLYGNVNSTHVHGTHVLNGIGGSGDFNRHSPLAVTALPSTAVDGDVSRVVPMVPHVDHTEHDVSVVVTEQGVADLRGLSPRERARALIEECAHPSFRGDLRDYLAAAEPAGGNVPHDLDRALSWHAEWRG